MTIFLTEREENDAGYISAKWSSVVDDKGEKCFPPIVHEELWIIEDANHIQLQKVHVLAELIRKFGKAEETGLPILIDLDDKALQAELDNNASSLKRRELNEALAETGASLVFSSSRIVPDSEITTLD